MAVCSGLSDSSVGGCQLSSSHSGYGSAGRRFLTRSVSVAALSAMRVSQLRNESPRNRARLRYAEKKASCTASAAASRSPSIRTVTPNR